jgi:RNA polymerase sigma-70 factor, ECF subfamily
MGDAPNPRQSFDRLVAALRPSLHRYCARMTGSVIDGEDVVQEAVVKAIEALAQAGELANPERWLFRIAHNAALDLLRRRARREAAHSDLKPDMIADTTSADSALAAAASLRTFMQLSVAQRSSIILMDVLGYSLEEIGSVTDMSIPAIKAALHRGRARLREVAQEPDDRPPPSLDASQRALLAAYVDRFNARDFDAVRDMLADEVRLELVTKRRMSGRHEVANYFNNYSRIADWRFVPGFVDGRPAILVFDPADPAASPAYFVLVRWAGDALAEIRDFRFARYAEGAELHLLDE